MFAGSAFLLVMLRAGAQSAEPMSVRFDHVIETRMEGFWSGPGGTVQYQGTGPGRCSRGACVYFEGRYSVDLQSGARRLIEDPPAAGPCYKESSRGGDDFELLEPAGKPRYRGTYMAGKRTSRVDASCRRFVYLSRSGQLTAVDLRTFKAEELGKADDWEADDRVIFVKKAGAKSDIDGGWAFLYDYRSGKVCERQRCPAPSRAEPMLDEFFRPALRTAMERKEGASDFKLVADDGAVRFEGSLGLDKHGAAAFAFSPDDRWFAFRGRSDRIMVVDLKTFVARQISTYSHSIAFSNGGRYLDGGGFYEVETGRKIALPYTARWNTPDDQWTLLPSPQGIALYSFAAGTTTAVISPMKLGIKSFSATGRYAVVSHSDHNPRVLAVHELPGGRLVASAEGDWKGLHFSPDERYLAVIPPDGADKWKRLDLWDLRYGVAVSFEFPREDYLFEFHFSGDGKWLAFNTNGELKAWRLPRGLIQRAVISRLKDVEAAVFARLKSGRAAALSDSASSYAERARALRPAKGEFESAAEHATRMKAADAQDVQLKAEAQGEARRIAAAWDLKDRAEGGKAREDVEAAADEEITETSNAALGAYDAESEEFPATFAVDGKTRSARLSVPRKDAPAAKARDMLATVVYRHQMKDGRPVSVDARISVSDADLGEVYSWSSGAGLARRARSAPSAPAKLELKAEFADADGDGRLASGETAKLTVTVENSGAGAAYGVSATLKPASIEGLSYASRHFIGEIAPGSSRTAVIPLKGLAGAGDASRALTVSASDANGFTADPFRVVFETRARRGARLTLAEFKIKEAGGDGIVTPGELVEVLLRLRNDGAGAAEAADVKLSGLDSDLFVQGEARRVLGAVLPGQTVEVRYTVFSNTSLAGDKMRYTAALSEGADAWDAPVEIPLRRALGATRELVVKGKILPVAGAAAEAVQKPIAKGAARADAYAVILGAEDYPKAARVSHARRDAAAFREYAVSVLGVPNDPAHLFYLDDGVTLAELRKAFSPNGWLARRVGPESDIFVFYAGHGAPSLDGKGAYLVPQDGDPNYAVETGFLVDDMLQALSGSKARSATVWLDACFSGADRESKPLLADARPLMLKADVRVPAEKVALFSAASGAQVSSAYPDKRHGLFTWFALRGLDGEADADKNGALTAGELADFMSTNVSRTAGSLDREQTPGFRGDRTRVLATYRR